MPGFGEGGGGATPYTCSVALVFVFAEIQRMVFVSVRAWTLGLACRVEYVSESRAIDLVLGISFFFGGGMRKSGKRKCGCR